MNNKKLHNHTQFNLLAYNEDSRRVHRNKNLPGEVSPTQS